jgi:transcriptional regulator with XRE-family HTH domain
MASEDGIGIGSLLRRERQARGVSQSSLARRTGIPQPAISRIERGHEVPSLERLSRLTAGLGLQPRLVLAPLAEDTGDELHREGVRRLTPGERLEQAAGWIDLVGELRGRAAR